ncbi:TPA: hypothetical protein IAC10_03705 [Candidatus Scatousia excrementigallinarum]|uniref:DUF5681 domain-containing protein n=1 Tax=Candidatus Scatousia excrementigallinarum TaxID=2840935 RepID=A0A9D1JM92_9BACT|nr:hypothetical protein [Candidatus Scatousia excrementigallinarum]
MEIDKDRLLKAAETIQNDNKYRREIKEKLYEVGYKKPPVSGQFKKGQSGNPKGRKKKVIPKTIMEALRLAFIKEITITNEKGSREKIPFIQAFAQKIVQDAIKNDGPTRKMLLQNLNLLNFDFWQMIEDKAFEDFEPETSKDDEQYLRETLYKLIDYYHLNQIKNE